MSWNSNLSPIPYLEKRLKYYKRFNTYYKNCIKKEIIVVDNKVAMKEISLRPPFTVKQLKVAIKNTGIKVKEFEVAIKKVKANH